ADVSIALFAEGMLVVSCGKEVDDEVLMLVICTEEVIGDSSITEVLIIDVGISCDE
ncbi:76_t:CDS:1, partial [Racocetra fulgida]